MTLRIPTRTLAAALTLGATALLGAGQAGAHASIPGIEGPDFAFTAQAGFIYGGDGFTLPAWMYADANGGGVPQYPGPTLILQQGVPVTIELRNMLPEATSIVFPGMEGVTASGGSPGLLTNEASPDNGVTVVTYSFTPTRPGTFHYHSGTHLDVQVELGLVGAIIVRPTGFDPMMPRAYEHPDSTYTHEYLVLMTEMDFEIPRLVGLGLMDQVDTTTFFPVYWFINGRNAPDTMLDPNVPWMPNQPYNCMPMMHPGDKMLLRLIGGGRDPHPFHSHGNNTTVIAIDGRLLESTPGAGADLAYSEFTIATFPGQTVDAIYEWTGAGLGWDVYGHAPDDPMEPNEYAPDHGKPIPVVLPENLAVTIGGMYSGSPFLGQFASVPPGQGTGNVMGEYTFMAHSHNEKEMTTNDVFPGGMMTMIMVVPHDVPIGHMGP